jgi:flagellar hook-associated protein 2
MTAPINFGGLSSGVQWNDIVDSTIDALKARNVTPITDRITLRGQQRTAWTTLQGLVEKLNTAARDVRTAGFGGFATSVPNSLSTGRSLLTATAGAQATPGRYRVEVVQVADTARVAGGSVTDTAAARNLTGTFSVNGTSIAVEATDSLVGIRDKINQAEAGVTATIVSEGGTAGRLVLTSASSGSGGLDVTDGTGGLARELGFLDSRSKPVTSATMAAAAALGLSVFPQPASIRIGNVTITADLATESLSIIAAKINAAGGSAYVAAEPFGSETRFRLVTDGNVTADPGDPGSQDVLTALGMAAGAYGAVPQAVQSSVFTNGSSGPATASTALTAIAVGGTAPGLAVGDAINIRGTRGDGTAVTFGLVVQSGDTMQTLLDRINNSTSGFGAGARPASASLSADGSIRLTDGTAGVSRLSLSLSITRADGSTGSLGPTSTAVAGRSRELQRGSDAVVVVDGQSFTRATNTLTDVIPGLTLNVRQAEVGTQIDVDVSRDEAGAAAAAKKLTEAYNAVVNFFDEQRVPDAPLYADSSLRRMMQSFTDALRTPVAANETYSRSVNVGMVLDRNGRLTFNEETFRTALANKPAEVEALFGFAGIGGAFVKASDDATRFGVGTISLNINTIISDVEKLRRRESDGNRRLEQRRQQLVQQYTRMEEALTRLQSQSGSLLASVQALQPRNQ